MALSFGNPAFEIMSAGDLDYIAKINNNFEEVSKAFGGVSSAQGATFLDQVLLLSDALGFSPDSGTIMPPTITPLAMGSPSSEYVARLNSNFAAVAASFGGASELVTGANSDLTIFRFIMSLLGGLPCLIGNHSYFCSKGSSEIHTQIGYAWLPSIPAIVHNATPRTQFLGGGKPYGEWWYMVIDKTGTPTWLLGETGDSVIVVGIDRLQRIPGTGLPSLPFFKVWVQLGFGEYLIFPPIQILPIFQLAPSPLVATDPNP